jgi:hypothetical protein
LEDYVKYFHCPDMYRHNYYGCGAGPFNGTQAFLDLGMKCPTCKRDLKPHREPSSQVLHRRKEHESAVAFVEAQFGQAAAESYNASKGKIK